MERKKGEGGLFGHGAPLPGKGTPKGGGGPSREGDPAPSFAGLFGTVYAGRSVLVTGHTGFKGSWLTLWLTLLGARVAGFSTCRPLSPRNFALCGLAERIALHMRGDVRDGAAVRRCVAEFRPEIVFHLAAQPILLDSYERPKETFDVNVQGTVNVLEAARATAAVRAVVAVTTDKVYREPEPGGGSPDPGSSRLDVADRGRDAPDRPFSEEDPIAGRDPYSASKAMADLAVRSYRLSWKEKGFAAGPCALAAARSGNAIGGGDFAPRRLLPDCFRSLMEGRPFSLKTPAAVRPWQHVLEPTSAYLWLGARLLGEGDAFAGAWNFGPAPEDRATCEDLARRVFELWGADFSPRVEPEPRRQARTLLIDSRKAASRLGWTPLWTWAEGVEKTTAWFREYAARMGKGEPAGMFDLCRARIEEYASLAGVRNAPWAG